jgi:hypothetical protein
VTLGNNNVVSGLYLQNFNGHGIFGSAVNNMLATQSFIQGNINFNGVELDSVTGPVIFQNNMVMNEHYIPNLIVESRSVYCEHC